MQYKLLHESDGQRTFAVILDVGDEVMDTLHSFVERKGITAAQLTAIGAWSDVVLMYFDWEKKDYLRIPVRTPLLGTAGGPSGGNPRSRTPSGGPAQDRNLPSGRGVPDARGLVP
jgi:hypothetical protein